MSFKSFLISKRFFKNLGALMVVGIILVFTIIKALDIYTGKGEFIIIPNLVSCDADSLLVLSSNDYLNYELIDSIYTDDLLA